MTENDQAAEGTSAAPAPKSSKATRPKLRLAMVGIIVVGAVGFLLVKGLGSSLDYFKTVPQALESKQQIGTSTFRLDRARHQRREPTATLQSRYASSGRWAFQVKNFHHISF